MSSTTPEPGGAPQMSDLDSLKTEMIRMASEQAFETSRNCEHCDGEGTVPGGPKVIHSRAGGFGADWDLEAVEQAIREAKAVRWNDGSLMGHDLGVQAQNDRVVWFAVTRPAVTR